MLLLLFSIFLVKFAIGSEAQDKEFPSNFFLTSILHVIFLKVMRMVEALEGKGFRLPLMKGEVELAEKLAAITRQVDISCPLPSF